MTPETKCDIRNALRAIADNHAATMTVLHKMLNDLSAQLDGERGDAALPIGVQVPTSKLPYVDTAMLSIVHGEHRCFLGNTIPYRFLVKLIGRPNRYFSYDELCADVWRGVRSEATVRSAVKIIRNKLRRALLHELANAIDGSVARHYGLILDGTAR